MSSKSNWFLQFFNNEEDDYIYNKEKKIIDCPPIFVSKVYLINDSGGKVSDSQCEAIIEALNNQLITFCNDWSLKPVRVERKITPPPGSYQLYITNDTTKTVGDAYGYHNHPDNDGSIKAYICANVILDTTNPARINNGILTSNGATGTSVSRVVSRELLEIISNSGSNKLYYAPASLLTIRLNKTSPPITFPSGTYLPVCAEISHAVNQQSYTIIISDSSKVEVSDYVLPSWFIENGKSPFNYNNSLTAAFQLSTSGYYSTDSSNIYSIKYN
jgi:hypothetical protein